MTPPDLAFEFPLREELLHLNHAAVGPWPQRTADAVAAFAAENASQGSLSYPQWVRVESGLRGQARALLNAPSADDIALLKSTSEGLSLVAGGLDWRAGDRVVGIADEFPSNSVVWQALAPHGVEFVAVDVSGSDPEAALLAACDARTRLLAVSSVHYATGLRLDLARLAAGARERGVLTCVDAIQSLGAAALDVQDLGLDFVVADGHKWLLGPEGLALFYCRADLRDALTLQQFGWHMVEEFMDFTRQDWEPAHSARRFECGSPNMVGIHGLSASLGLLLEVGLQRVESEVVARSRYLIEGLRRVPGLIVHSDDGDGRSLGIVNFGPAAGDPDALFASLWDNGVFCARRGPGVRFSPHFYTPYAKLDRALELARAAC